MTGKIELGVAPYGYRCDTCQNANYRDPGMAEPLYPCAIYTLAIGTGYRQPSYLCPNCLNYLRALIGAGTATTITFVPDAGAAAPAAPIAAYHSYRAGVGG